MQINVNFNNIHSKRIASLYLFYKIRMFAAANGGWFTGFVMTKNEKYKVLPKLRSLGWIEKNEDKVVKYRTLLNRDACLGVFCNILPEHLGTISDFKTFILSTTESYILRKRWKIQNKKSFKTDSRDNTKIKRDWDYVNSGESRHRVKKIESKSNDPEYLGRAYNEELSKITGLTIQTISNWRKECRKKGVKYNTYYYKNVRTDIMSVDAKSKAVVSGREGAGGWSKKLGGFVVTDLTTKTCYEMRTYESRRYRPLHMNKKYSTYLTLKENTCKIYSKPKN